METWKDNLELEFKKIMLKDLKKLLNSIVRLYRLSKNQNYIGFYNKKQSIMSNIDTFFVKYGYISEKEYIGEMYKLIRNVSKKVRTYPDFSHIFENFKNNYGYKEI
jgi:hypothetical protein